MKRLLAVLVLSHATLALAEGQSWSTVGGRTLPPGANAFALEVGWPGLDVSWRHGAVPGLDVGLRAGFIYGVQGLLSSVVPGLEVRGLLKARLLDSDVVSLAFTFEPGAFFAGPVGGPTRAGVVLPVGLRLGVAASSAFSVGVLVEVPVWAELGPGGGWNIPLLSGVGLEYFFTSQVAFFAQVKLGPSLRPTGAAALSLDARAGVSLEF